MPIEENNLTSKQIRNKWIIGLESGFFKPDSTYLRILDLKTYEYRHTALGVLCAVSKLGEFLEPNREDTIDSSKDLSVRYIYSLYKNTERYKNSDRLISSNKRWVYNEYRYPPQSLLYLAGLDRYHYNPHYTFEHRTITAAQDLRDELSPEYAKYLADPMMWGASINKIMEDSNIPTHEKFPMLGAILRIAEKQGIFFDHDEQTSKHRA